MTLEQMRYFITSAQEGSFSAAAQRLYVSQSSVSRGVSSLEQELGCELFLREKYSLRLTPAGETLFDMGQELLQQTVRIRDSMAQFSARRSVTIACALGYLPEFYDRMRIFQSRYPDTEIRIRQTEQRLAAQQVLSGEADLAVSFSYVFPNDPGLESVTLAQGEFRVLVSVDHPFASRSFINQDEITKHPEFLGENPYLDGSQTTMDSRDVQSNILKIKTGKGMIILPEHAAAEFGSGCACIPVRGPHRTYQVLMCRRKNNTSPALQSLFSFFRERLPG